MEQEFNDQKHVTSAMVCACVLEPQATQQIYTRKSIGAISFQNYTDDGTMNALRAKNIHPLIEFNLSDFNSELWNQIRSFHQITILFLSIFFSFRFSGSIIWKFVECNGIPNDILFFQNFLISQWKEMEENEF